MKIKHYQIHCATDGVWEDWFIPEGDPEPSTCPTDTGHTVTADSATYVKTVGPMDVEIQGIPSVTLSHPTTSDKKPIFTNAVFPGNMNIYFSGRGDDIDGGTRGKGPAFSVKQTGPTTGPGHKTVVWQYIDSVYMIGGRVDALKGGEGDVCHFDLVADATSVVPNGTTEGNCDLSDLGGALPAAICIVPTVGGAATGAYDVDVDEALNANVANKADGSSPNKITKAVPVPGVGPVDEGGHDTPGGFWNWDSTTGVITPAIGGAGEPLGYWNLYAAQLVLTHWVEGLQLWDLTDDGSGARSDCEFMLPSKAKKILPHWHCCVTFELVSTNSVRATWLIYLGREKTT